MVDRDHYHIAQTAHVGSVIGQMLDGGAGLVTAAVEPEEDRTLFFIGARGPDIQIQTVLVHGPEAMGHVQFPIRPVVGEQGTDKAVTAGDTKIATIG